MSKEKTPWCPCPFKIKESGLYHVWNYIQMEDNFDSPKNIKIILTIVQAVLFPDWLLTPVNVDPLDEELSPPLVRSSTEEADSCCFRILWFILCNDNRTFSNLPTPWNLAFKIATTSILTQNSARKLKQNCKQRNDGAQRSLQNSIFLWVFFKL